MDHSKHHHVNTVVRAPSGMNHGQHIAPKQTNTTSIHSGHGSHHDMMSSMTFHGGFTEKILFDQWSTNSIGGFIGSWFIIFFVAILYEGLKTVRDHLAKREACRQHADENNRQTARIPQHDQHHDPTNNDNLIPRVRTENVRSSKRARFLSIHHIFQTALHIIQMGISYLLMLIAMTFNTYLFLAVILGAGVGHLLFGWRRSSVIDYNEHCH